MDTYQILAVTIPVSMAFLGILILYRWFQSRENLLRQKNMHEEKIENLRNAHELAIIAQKHALENQLEKLKKELESKCRELQELKEASSNYSTPPNQEDAT